MSWHENIIYAAKPENAKVSREDFREIVKVSEIRPVGNCLGLKSMSKVILVKNVWAKTPVFMQR